MCDATIETFYAYNKNYKNTIHTPKKNISFTKKIHRSSRTAHLCTFFPDQRKQSEKWQTIRIIGRKKNLLRSRGTKCMLFYDLVSQRNVVREA